MMYLLMGWRKPGDEGYEVIAASEDFHALSQTADSLNHAAGYEPGCGLWSDKTKGCFRVIHVRVMSTAEATGVVYRRGISFIKHEERWREAV